MLKALDEPLFRMVFFSSLFAMAAADMTMIARSWLAYDLTGSALALGLVAGARAIPQLCLTLIGGVAADRFSKRTLLLVTQAGLCLCALANAILVHTGIVAVWHLVVIGIAQGAFFALNQPARQGFIPEVVSAQTLPNAIAINATGMNLNKVLAPAVGGVLLAWHPVLAFYAITLLYIGGIVMVFRLPQGLPAVVQTTSALQEVAAGLKYFWDHTQLRVLMIMASIPIIIGMPFQQLLPVFQADVFLLGPTQLGMMFAASGLGSLLSSVVITSLAQSPHKAKLQMASGIGFGVSLFLFALAPGFGAALAMLFLVGMFAQAYMTLNQIMIMTTVDRQFYGRAASIRMMAWTITPGTLLILGAFVDIFGAPSAVAVQGLLVAGFFIAVSARYRTLWRPAASPAATD